MDTLEEHRYWRYLRINSCRGSSSTPTWPGARGVLEQAFWCQDQRLALSHSCQAQRLALRG